MLDAAEKLRDAIDALECGDYLNTQQTIPDMAANAAKREPDCRGGRQG